MPITIVSNKPRTSVVLHATGPNTSINITGNNTVSNIASSNTEILTGAFITQAAWGVAAGAIIIKRGANTVAVYDSTGQHEYAGCGMPITVGKEAANLSVEFTGAGAGFIIFELQKIGTFANSEYF